MFCKTPLLLAAGRTAILFHILMRKPPLHHLRGIRATGPLLGLLNEVLLLLFQLRLNDLHVSEPKQADAN